MRLILLLILLLHTGLQEAASSRSLSAELTFDKNVYYPGECINFNLRIKNSQDRSVSTYFNLPASLILYRRTEHVLFKRYLPAWIQILKKRFLTPEKCLPDQTLDLEGELFYDSSLLQHCLDLPGEYEFKVEFKGVDDRTFESEPVRVKVLPLPEDEKPAFEALKDQTLAQFLEGDLRIHWGRDQNGRVVIVTETEVDRFQEGAEKALAFLERFPDSIYTPTVRKLCYKRLSEEAARSGGSFARTELQTIYQWMLSQHAHKPH